MLSLEIAVLLTRPNTTEVSPIAQLASPIR